MKKDSKQPTTKTYAATSRQPGIRETREAKILESAEQAFAKYGYNGATMAGIAAGADISKQNLIYYFPSKNHLYELVLQDILEDWIGKMVLFEQSGGDPAHKLQNYIHGKIEFSRTRPSGSKVFANEIINGASHLSGYLRERLLPQLSKDVELVRRWIAEGKMDSVDPMHLFFMIWAATQTYADFSAQISLVLEKDELKAQDYQAASETLTYLVLKGTGIHNTLK